MCTTVHELKTWYNSQRTKFGRLKQVAKKSGQGDEGVSATDQWTWDNFQLLVHHSVDTERMNVVGFKSKLNSATASTTSGATPVLCKSSNGTEGDTQAFNIPPQAPSKLPSSTHDDTDNLGTMLKKFLAKKSLATLSTDGASYSALYVGTILKQLSGSLRREAEHRIQQVLHDVEHNAEQQRSQQGVTQQPQRQGYHNWQPHPSQWPKQLQEQAPNVWHSQDKQWVHNQFPEQVYSSLSPMASTSGTLTADSQSRSSDIQSTDLEPAVEDVASPSWTCRPWHGTPEPNEHGGQPPIKSSCPRDIDIDTSGFFSAILICFQCLRPTNFVLEN